MSWRAAILVDVPNLARATSVIRDLAQYSAVLESLGGAQRRVVVTVDGLDKVVAGENAMRIVRDALGELVTGDQSLEEVESEE